MGSKYFFCGFSRLFCGCAVAFLMLGLMCGCRSDEIIVVADVEDVPEARDPASCVGGFYLVNEGNMGSNKCTIDFFDLRHGVYYRNIYSQANPSVVMELGDVGNDAIVYGSRLYVAVNCSHKVEIMDVASGRRLGKVDVPNCRSFAMCDGKVYVSSYVSETIGDFDAPLGMVCEIDTASMLVTRTVNVGYQPEEMAVVGRCLYVANSGGYRAPYYDNTVSVIDLDSFQEVSKLEVDINLHRMVADDSGQLWVSSRGDGKSRPSRLYVLDVDKATGQISVGDVFAMPCTAMALDGDRLYVMSGQTNSVTGAYEKSYGVLDTRSRTIVSESFITDGTDLKIVHPYGIAVNPYNGDIMVTDAKNYVSSGQLYCFGRDGVLKWSVRTGDIPTSIAFVKASR